MKKAIVIPVVGILLALIVYSLYQRYKNIDEAIENNSQNLKYGQISLLAASSASPFQPGA